MKKTFGSASASSAELLHSKDGKTFTLDCKGRAGRRKAANAARLGNPGARRQGCAARHARQLPRQRAARRRRTMRTTSSRQSLAEDRRRVRQAAPDQGARGAGAGSAVQARARHARSARSTRSSRTPASAGADSRRGSRRPGTASRRSTRSSVSATGSCRRPGHRERGERATRAPCRYARRIERRTVAAGGDTALLRGQ